MMQKKGDKLTSADLNWECKDGTLHFDMRSMTMMGDNGQEMNMAETGMGVDVTGDELDLLSDPNPWRTTGRILSCCHSYYLLSGKLFCSNRKFLQEL